MALKEHDTAASPDPPRDPVLDRAYAAGALEEPPARLDAAILAAARREVRARPTRPGSVLRAWRAPIALAAVLVLSVSVVMLLREEGADRLDPAPLPAAQAPAADNVSRAQPAAPSVKPESPQRSAPQGEVATRSGDVGALRDAPANEEDHRRKKQAEPGAAPAEPRLAEEPRPAPRPFAEPPAASAELRRSAPEAAPSQTGNLAKEIQPGAAAGAGVMGRAAPAPPPASMVPETPDVAAGALAGRTSGAPADPAASRPTVRAERQRLDDRSAAESSRPVWQGFESQPPEKWLERVAELRRAGREAEAQQMLTEFRRRFPEHPVPADPGR